MVEQLKQQVLQANRDLVKYNLVTLTWGNVSGIAREEGLVVIKPSGVEYEKLTVDDMVVLDLAGNIKEGKLRPSSDTPTHLRLYQAFQSVNGITHTHSPSATVFAQACKEIPCFGTTHADHFHGTIPVTRFLTEKEVEEDYEGNTGTVIIERFNGLDPVSMPGILVAGHAPFAFGKNAMDSTRNALILERVAAMALESLVLNPSLHELPKYISEKHFQRKHGPHAYYGQKK